MHAHLESSHAVHCALGGSPALGHPLQQLRDALGAAASLPMHVSWLPGKNQTTASLWLCAALGVSHLCRPLRQTAHRMYAHMCPLVLLLQCINPVMRVRRRGDLCLLSPSSERPAQTPVVDHRSHHCILAAQHIGT